MSELPFLPDAPRAVAVLLLSTRLSALLWLTPLLQSVPLPGTARAVLVLGLSAALAPVLAGPVPTAGLGPLGLAVLGEAVLGALLGLGVTLAFSGFALAGRLLDLQVGFGIGQVYDPLTRLPTPVLSSLLGLLGVLLFFLLEGHHALLRGIALSLDRFPLGQVGSLAAAGEPLLRQAAGQFTLGFALAAPVVLCLLLADFALGILARNLPQANIFLLGLPVKLVVALLGLSAGAAGMGAVASRVHAGIFRAWAEVFAAASGGLR